jgi:NAD(P)-dependent dehydrogenase (short-subunit alcohol dehydrogenase family)
MSADSLFGLEGKKALVVGGGQGMGESSVRYLAQAGCDVAVLDLDPARAERVATAVQAWGRRGVPIIADVTEDDQIEPAVAAAERNLGGLDILVTIVGQAAIRRALDVTPAQWDREQRRNVRYFFFVAQAVARSLIRRQVPGAIVAVASVSGLQSAPNHVPYGAAKAGLINMVRSLAVEWAPYNIRVNAVAPGLIITPRLPDTEEQRQRVQRSLIPMRRRGTTDEIGKSILYLASDLASYVTGQTLAVDGGFTAAFVAGPPEVSAAPDRG